MAHARAGGSRSRAVVDYLASFGDTDWEPDPAVPDATDRATMIGTYAYGDGDSERLEVLERQGVLAIRRIGHPARRLYRLVEEAQRKAIAAVRPGVEASAVAGAVVSARA